jgi:hypothetical protein
MMSFDFEALRWVSNFIIDCVIISATQYSLRGLFLIFIDSLLCILSILFHLTGSQVTKLPHSLQSLGQPPQPAKILPDTGHTSLRAAATFTVLPIIPPSTKNSSAAFVPATIVATAPLLTASRRHLILSFIFTELIWWPLLLDFDYWLWLLIIGFDYLFCFLLYFDFFDTYLQKYRMLSLKQNVANSQHAALNYRADTLFHLIFAFWFQL